MPAAMPRNIEIGCLLLIRDNLLLGHPLAGVPSVSVPTVPDPFQVAGLA